MQQNDCFIPFFQIHRVRLCYFHLSSSFYFIALPYRYCASRSLKLESGVNLSIVSFLSLPCLSYFQTFLFISSFLAEVFIMLSATLSLPIKRINTSAVRRMVIKSELSKDILLTVIKISMSIYPNV